MTGNKSLVACECAGTGEASGHEESGDLQSDNYLSCDDDFIGVYMSKLNKLTSMCTTYCVLITPQQSCQRKTHFLPSSLQRGFGRSVICFEVREVWQREMEKASSCPMVSKG